MQNGLFRHIFFKYLLLLLLSLKVSEFVYESFSSIVNIEKKISSIDADTDVGEDSEQQNDEKNEFDQNHKINQIYILKLISKKKIKSNFHPLVVKDYRNFHLEFTTPPPEFA